MIVGSQDRPRTQMKQPRPAYETLIGPLEERMVRAIWRIVRDPHDAEDAMQNALGVVWKRWDRVGRHPNPTALVLKICVDAACDVLRLRARRGSNSDDVDVVDSSRSASQELEDRETYREVTTAIRTLSRQQATAFSLRVLEEMPYDEIATALGCGEATARKHVERARAHLRVALADYAPNRTTGSQS